MSSLVEAKCPNCGTTVSVEEDLSAVPVNCSSCQSSFVPAEVIAESNKRFEIGMYLVMLAVGIGLIVYMAMTGRLQPKPDQAPAPQAVQAEAAE